MRSDGQQEFDVPDRQRRLGPRSLVGRLRSRAERLSRCGRGLIAVTAIFLLVAISGLGLTRAPVPGLVTRQGECPDAPHVCGPDFQVAATAWDSPAQVEVNVVVKVSPSRARILEIAAELANSRSDQSMVLFVFDESVGPERYGFGADVSWQGPGERPLVTTPAARESWVATYSAIPGMAPFLVWGPAAPTT